LRCDSGMKTLDESQRSDLAPGESRDVVQVSLLFCDVVRSTELTRRLGDRAAYRVIHDFHSLVLDAVAGCDGHELELRGDGVLLSFDKPEHAVDCAGAIQRGLLTGPVSHRLSARIGVHTGEALRVSNGYFGSNVILSARIAEAAAPGEILLSGSIVQHLADRELSVAAGRWVYLKGIPEATLVFSLRWRPRRAVHVKPRCHSTVEALRAPGHIAESGLPGEEPSCMLEDRSAV
jgi:adenylate cyclase